MILNRDNIEATLDASRQAVEAALLGVYDRQTVEIRMPKTSPFYSGIGFAPDDRDYMATLAAQLKRGKALTPVQLDIARRKMKRNWGQIVALDKARAIPESVIKAMDCPVVKPSVIAAMPEFASW